MAGAGRALRTAACAEAAAQADRGGGRSASRPRRSQGRAECPWCWGCSAPPAAPGLEPPGRSFVWARAEPGSAPCGRVVVAAALPLPAPPRSGRAGAISEGAISCAPRGWGSAAALALVRAGEAGEKRRCALEALWRPSALGSVLAGPASRVRSSPSVFVRNLTVLVM